MQKEIVCCEKTREIMGLRLTPVVRSTITMIEIGGSISYYASRQPVYLLIESQPGVRALRLTGEEITLDQVYSECPSIREDPAAGFPVLPAPGY